MNTKTDEQIAKDRESVKAMHGAKSAMEAALRRITTLEGALRDVRRGTAEIGASHGEHVYLRVYRMGEWKVLPSEQLFKDIDDIIRKVL